MAMFALRALALCACMCVTLGVKFEDNGYHIKVAINKQVPEDPQIITQLKEALVSASAYLHQTTRNHFYIKNVTILVPETWATKPEWKPSSLIFREADIRVDSPHPSMVNTPYTFQHGLCGDAGRYIHLTPDFVLDKGKNRDEMYGDFGRLLVHEFAHLRYGVFDEYGAEGDSLHPVGYVNQNRLEPTACSKDITGRFLNMNTNKTCVLNRENRLPDDCAFIVNKEKNTATSSVMFAQYLKAVTDFCETNTTNPKLKHNADAPNKQNKMCNGRGTWDIIKEHPDFSYSSANNVTDTTPTFEVVQHQIKVVNGTGVCGRRFVFVLDTSGSMTDNNRYFKLRQMADQIIRDILPDGTEVGIVVFSDDSRVWADMRYLTSDAERQKLAEGLPTLSDFEGYTAIGKGLLKGIKLLNITKEGRIFLITDGDENVAPKVSGIMSNISKSHVVVHTLAYSDAAYGDLRELSRETRGKYSYFGENEESTELEGAAQFLPKDISICESVDTVVIDRHAAILNPTSKSHTRNVTIDPTVGNNTLFVFTLSNGASTKVEIEDPNGEVHDEKSSSFKKDETLNIIRFHFPYAKEGTWKYTLEQGSTSHESVVAVVTSHQRTEGISPFDLEAWLSNTTFIYEKDRALVIYSYVHQGYAPIIKAEVNMVFHDGSLKKEKMMNDDGMYPDNTADDGIYTGFVVGFRGPKVRHSLVVSATSVDGKTKVINSSTFLPSGAPVIYPKQFTPVVLKLVEPFTRISSAGAVDVEGFDENVDQFDPVRVTDLEVIISDRGNRQVTLTWTAPGDDLDEGTVDRYDIRIAESFEHLRQNFSSSYKILESDIKKGDNSPVPAGSQQSMTVSLSGHLDGDSYVFGLKAFDESNRSSDLSNLKAVTFAKIVIPGSPLTPEETSVNVITIVSVCSVVLVLIIIIVLVIVAVRLLSVKDKYKVSKADQNKI